MLNMFGVCLITDLLWSSREVSRGPDHVLFHSSCVDLGFAALGPRKLFCLNFFFEILFFPPSFDHTTGLPSSGGWISLRGGSRSILSPLPSSASA